MKKRDLKSWIKTFSILVISGVLILSLAAVAWIGLEVKNSCNKAQREFTGNCVEALMYFVDDQSQSFQDRNTAIWSLGQLGDPQALPVLEKYYTGDIPEREPLTEMISQYELKKAINLVKGGQNISAPFWRWMVK